MSPALVRVEQGTTLIPVANVGFTRARPYPHHLLGLLVTAAVEGLSVGISEDPLDMEAVVAGMQTPDGDTGQRSVREQIQALDLSVFSESQQEQVQAFLLKHEPMFSAFEGDLGCTNLISLMNPCWMTNQLGNNTGDFPI